MKSVLDKLKDFEKLLKNMTPEEYERFEIDGLNKARALNPDDFDTSDCDFHIIIDEQSFNNSVSGVCNVDEKTDISYMAIGSFFDQILAMAA